MRIRKGRKVIHGGGGKPENSHVKVISHNNIPLSRQRQQKGGDGGFNGRQLKKLCAWVTPKIRG